MQLLSAVDAGAEVRVTSYGFGVGYIPFMAESVTALPMSDARTCNTHRLRGLHLIMTVQVGDTAWKEIIPIGPQSVFTAKEVAAMKQAVTLDNVQPDISSFRRTIAAVVKEARCSSKVYRLQLGDGRQYSDKASHCVVPETVHVPFCVRAYATITEGKPEYEDSHVFVLPAARFQMADCTLAFKSLLSSYCMQQKCPVNVDTALRLINASTNSHGALEALLGTAFRGKAEELIMLHDLDLEKITPMAVPKHILKKVEQPTAEADSIITSVGGADVNSPLATEVASLTNEELRAVLQDARSVHEKIILRARMQSAEDPSQPAEFMTVDSSCVRLPSFLEDLEVVDGVVIKKRRPIVVDYHRGDDEEKKKLRALTLYFNMRLAEDYAIADMKLNMLANPLGIMPNKIGVMVHEDVVENIYENKADPYAGVSAEALLMPRDPEAALRSGKWYLVLLAGNTTYWAQYSIVEKMTPQQ